MFNNEQKKKSHIQLKIVLALVIVLSIVFTVAVTAAEANTNANKKEENTVETNGVYIVSVREGENVISFETDLKDAYEIIGSKQILLGENDTLDLSDFTPGKGGEIVVVRECNITIVDHDNVIKLTATGSVYDALENNKVFYKRNDVVDQYISKYVSDGMVINITDGVEIKVIDNGETRIYGVPSSCTVGSALKYAGIELGKDDILSVKENMKVKRNMTIQIKRVEYKEKTETQPIKYETVEKKVTNIPVGTTQIQTQGKDGVKKVTYSEKYIDGVFSGKTVKNEKTVEEAVNKVVLVGVKKEVSTTKAVKAVQASASTKTTTKPTTTKTVAKTTATKAATTTKPATTKAAVKNTKSNSSVKTVSNFTLPSKYSLNSSNVPTSYKKKLTGSATAYYGDGSTSTGKKPQPGYVAVDPRIIPYGTEMWIVSNDGRYVYGYAIAADTGGFIYSGNTIVDLFFNTYNECVNFGRRDVTIYIL